MKLFPTWPVLSKITGGLAFFTISLALTGCPKGLVTKTNVHLPTCFVQLKADDKSNQLLFQCLRLKPCFMGKDTGPKNGRARFCQPLVPEEPSTAILELTEDRSCRMEISVNFLSNSASYSVSGQRLNFNREPVRNIWLLTSSQSHDSMDDEKKKHFIQETCYAAAQLAISLYEQEP